MPTRPANADLRSREYLTPAEIEKLIKAAKEGRWPLHDATLIIVAYRHGLRAKEACELEWSQVEFGRNAALHVRRAKDPDQTDNVFASWAEGFITCMNVGMVTIGVYFDMGAKTPDEMRHFLRKYCNDHPLANFGNAAVEHDLVDCERLLVERAQDIFSIIQHERRAKSLRIRKLIFRNDSLDIL
jgi:hypothetical protein